MILSTTGTFNKIARNNRKRYHEQWVSVYYDKGAITTRAITTRSGILLKHNNKFDVLNLKSFY